MSGLRRIEQIGGRMDRFTGRPWSADEVADCLTLAIPEIVPALGFRLAESCISARLPEGGDRIAIPSGFLGTIRVMVDGERFERVAYDQLRTGGRRYALRSNWIVFAPAGGGCITVEYRGIERTGGVGDGVSIDRTGEIAFDMAPGADTGADADAQGRHAFTIDGITGSLDEIDASYNAIGRMMDTHPGVFLYGALKHGTVMVQDDEGARRYGALQQQAIADARNAFLAADWGGDKLQMRRR